MHTHMNRVNCRLQSCNFFLFLTSLLNYKATTPHPFLCYEILQHCVHLLLLLYFPSIELFFLFFCIWTSSVQLPCILYCSPLSCCHWNLCMIQTYKMASFEQLFTPTLRMRRNLQAGVTITDTDNWKHIHTCHISSWCLHDPTSNANF